MNWTLEVVVVPVADVGRARDFYADRLGFAVDHDTTTPDGNRFVQLTPPGSGCSICLGEGLTDAEPGSIRGMQMVVADADEAHALLTERGVEVTPVDDQPWGRFVYFADPDGNQWAIQEIVIPDLG
jgi:catechol 2,3-dioxygenase-like lactoylglutathione lyase family enzyme